MYYYTVQYTIVDQGSYKYHDLYRDTFGSFNTPTWESILPEKMSSGVFLKVDAGRQLVFTDAFVSAWVPSAKPFMVGDITFADSADGGTHYIARALHWTESDQKQHEAMGFHQGWDAATKQLEALAASL